ncbi:alpha/beta hydrolase [Rapidithrix thailandica]|uniref:Alpha/beta hydrolase n=1 Tax=Rapidithrix thailandica TaxID=413964 RepID=A0AAW9RZ80_9BACT
MQFRTSDKQITKSFSSKSFAYTIEKYTYQGHQIRYVSTQLKAQKPKITLLFIHGAPGSSDAFYTYLQHPKLLAHARLVSVDRPGYGYSDFGKSITSIQEQARLLQPILQKFHSASHPVVLVGHSYGGTIAARLAMDFPELANHLIMLSPAIDPDLEKIFWFSNLPRTFPFHWLSPRSFKVAADEKFTHEEELREMLPYWEKICIPVWHVHGNKDQIVPYLNVEFSRKMLGHVPLKIISLPNANHFIPWKEEKQIISIILHSIRTFSRQE